MEHAQKIKRRVLFLCATNSCRSQMAEGILRVIGKGEFDVHSAGAQAASVNPLAIKVMHEAGIDISGQSSKSVVRFTGEEFDYVVTLCGENAKVACPVFWGKATHRLHWDFPDPAEAQGSRNEKLQVFRKVRGHIRAKIEGFIKESKEGE